jgi:hypothetical protein
VIAGFEHRWQVEAQLAALEREKGSGHMNPAWLQKIEEQIRLFEGELKRMDREGDYEEPGRSPRQGPFSWVDDQGGPIVV